MAFEGVIIEGLNFFYNFDDNTCKFDGNSLDFGGFRLIKFTEAPFDDVPLEHLQGIINNIRGIL
jgi:hypothetical protein